MVTAAYQRAWRRRRGHLVLVEGMTRLSIEHLTHFLTPKTWPEILELEPRMRRSRWVDGIVLADEYGAGLLRWVPASGNDRGAWVLTVKGRELVTGRR